MAYIKTLKDNELIGGTDNTDVYPVSTTQAIFSQKPDGTIPEGIKHQRLEDRLFDGEEDARELHRKAEKLVPYISGVLKEVNNNEETTINSPIEINGKVHKWYLTGSAGVETYGDEPTLDVAIEDMTAKGLIVEINPSVQPETVPGETAEPIENKHYKWQGIYTILNQVGTYKARFNCNYNGISKSSGSISVATNLRKYFGFVPSDVIEQGNDAVLQYLIAHTGNGTTSDFSNSVGWTGDIPANDTGLKHIYFAVPNRMAITQVIQTASQLELALEPYVIANRSISGIGNTFPYKLYKTVRTPDSSESKNVLIK